MWWGKFKKHTCGIDGDPGAVAPLDGRCQACISKNKIHDKDEERKMDSVIGYANGLVNEPLYGDLDYYIAIAAKHKSAIRFFANYIAEQDKTITALKSRIADLERRNHHLTDRVLRYALGKPQEVPLNTYISPITEVSND